MTTKMEKNNLTATEFLDIENLFYCKISVILIVTILAFREGTL